MIFLVVSSGSVPSLTGSVGKVDFLAAFCTVIRTRINSHSLVMAGEVDCFELVSRWWLMSSCVSWMGRQLLSRISYSKASCYASHRERKKLICLPLTDLSWQHPKTHIREWVPFAFIYWPNKFIMWASLKAIFIINSVNRSHLTCI